MVSIKENNGIVTLLQDPDGLGAGRIITFGLIVPLGSMIAIYIDLWIIWILLAVTLVIGTIESFQRQVVQFDIKNNSIIVNRELFGYKWIRVKAPIETSNLRGELGSGFFDSMSPCLTLVLNSGLCHILFYFDSEDHFDSEIDTLIPELLELVPITYTEKIPWRASF